MSYKTYTTEALVCGTFARNTADGSFLLFTKEAGMLYASAKSVREERSRQRYALQDFSLIRVSLVKGKSGWRVGSIESNKNYYHLAPDKITRGGVVSLFRLLRRFLKGEEPAPELFDYVIGSLEKIVTNAEKSQFLQLASSVVVLAELGYVDKKQIPDGMHNLSPEKLDGLYSNQLNKKLENLYSQAVTASHL